MHFPCHRAKEVQGSTEQLHSQNNSPTPEEVQLVLCAACSQAAIAAMHVVVAAVEEVKPMASELVVQVLIHNPGDLPAILIFSTSRDLCNTEHNTTPLQIFLLPVWLFFFGANARHAPPWGA
jgi:hypothetical protein